MMYHKDLPKTWIKIIEQDEVLKEIWEDHDSEYEVVPEFLFQEVRGEMERLKPIFALYGESGLEMYEKLQEIDTVTTDTAKTVIDGEVYYAGYFFAKANKEKNKDEIVALIKQYIKKINDIYVNDFQEDALMDEDAKIEFMARDDEERIEIELDEIWDETPECDMHDGISDWFIMLDRKEECEELGDMLDEALYHINDDYYLSYYIQWSIIDMPERKNPFLPYYKLYCMGIDIRFVAKDRVVVFI